MRFYTINFAYRKNQLFIHCMKNAEIHRMMRSIFEKEMFKILKKNLNAIRSYKPLNRIIYEILSFLVCEKRELIYEWFVYIFIYIWSILYLYCYLYFGWTLVFKSFSLDKITCRTKLKSHVILVTSSKFSYSCPTKFFPIR